MVVIAFSGTIKVRQALASKGNLGEGKMAEQVVTQPANKSILTNLLQEFSPNRLLSSLVAGVVSGVLAVVVAISLAALIFSGNLSGYV